MDNRILVVDDEESVCWAFRELLTTEGYKVETAPSAEEGLVKASRFKPNLVILDVRLPGMDGIAAIQSFKKRCPETVVVIVTAHGTTQTASEAIRQGAVDYLLKPIEDIDTVIRVVRKGLAQTESDKKVHDMRVELARRGDLDLMVGVSTPMQDIFKQIGALARSDVTALLRGESGTGKELCARLIHYNSDRKEQPFVTVNCASLPETLLESELFGHEKGSFTGAYKEKKGYFEIADGGTLFLDEIGDFSLLSQVKLLNFLETRTFEKVGGTTPQRVDVRIVAATNRDLEELVHQNKFREDLYFRLNVVELRLPPLRERISDLPLLAAYFLVTLERRTAQRKHMSLDAMEQLKKYTYPGNVRELRNAIERAWFLSEGEVILPEHLPHRIRNVQPPAAKPREVAVEEVVDRVCRELFVGGETEDLYPKVIERFEEPLIKWAMKLTSNNQVQSSKILGINRSTLRKLIDKYSLM
jgi:DNA-binding NtrC family response regulator